MRKNNYNDDDENNGDNKDGDEDNGSRVRQKNRRKKEKQEKIKWSSNEQDVIISPFTGEPGPKVTISSNPSKIFLTFFTTALLDLTVTETNRYASKCLKHDDWQTSRDEIQAYFGFCILMAMNKVLDLYHYWSTCRHEYALCCCCFQNYQKAFYGNKISWILTNNLAGQTQILIGLDGFDQLLIL